MIDRSPSPPPALHPPDHDKESNEGSTPKSFILSVGISLFLLLIMAATVIWVLPQKKTTLPEAPTAVAPVPQTGEEPARNEEEQDAQKLLHTWLSLNVRAEADNIALWGRDEYAGIRETVAAADADLQSRAFGEATKKYTSAVEQLERLLSQKDAMLETALAKGNEALVHNESMVAAEAFQQALAIDPDNNQALKGAHRAAVRDEVTILFAQALEKEKAGDLSSALAVLTRLLALDEAYGPGLEAHSRIAAAAEDSRFQKAMTACLRSLKNNNLTAARSAYAQAKKLRGNDPAVQHAGKLLAEAEEAATLQILREKAEQQSTEERWSDALVTYNEALTIAPQAIFAVNGRREAQQRAELDIALESILAHSERLQEDAPLKEAQQAHDYAAAMAAPGPRLQKQIHRLSQVLDFATTPVTINLNSDNETDVVIYRVGPMGRFLHKRLTLRPGSYTVVGSKPGYRDVRLTMNVNPDKGAVEMLIVCEEPI